MKIRSVEVLWESSVVRQSGRQIHRNTIIDQQHIGIGQSSGHVVGFHQQIAVREEQKGLIPLLHPLIDFPDQGFSGDRKNRNTGNIELRHSHLSLRCCHGLPPIMEVSLNRSG